MIKKILKHKKLLAATGGITLAALGGIFLYKSYKKNQEKEEKFTKVLRLITLHQTRYYHVVYNNYFPIISRLYSEEIKILQEKKGKNYAEDELCQFVLNKTFEINPFFKQNLENITVEICNRIGVDKDEWRKWESNILKNSSKNTETLKWLNMRNTLNFAFLRGKIPHALNKENIIFPDFLTIEFQVRYAEYLSRFAFTNYVKFYRENMKEKGPDFNFNLEYQKSIGKGDIEIIEESNKFLEKDEYFGKNWDEIFDLHPIIYVVFHKSEKMLNNVQGMEVVVKLKEVDSEMPKLMYKFRKEDKFGEEFVDDLENSGNEILDRVYQEAYEMINKE